LKLSDFSISSIDCAVALSSSISRTRILIPLKEVRDQTLMAEANTVISIPERNTAMKWLTKDDSGLQ
jgi:hypothetical protein